MAAEATVALPLSVTVPMELPIGVVAVEAQTILILLTVVLLVVLAEAGSLSSPIQQVQ
jgi:hypothetical protein